VQVRAAGERLVVLELTADWCHECVKIAPFFERLAGEQADASFCAVDVDASRELSEAFGASALPLFVFLRRGKTVGALVGAQQTALRKKVLRHARSS
jgi:thioredoxin-like negative regulator of GroEL